jgi:hypothetical protein
MYSIVIIAMCILVSGCATMYSQKAIMSQSRVTPGADVYYGAQMLGTTPLTYSFKRDTFERKTLSIRKKGYKSQEVLLEKTLEKKALYNIAFITTTLGVTSWGIDAGSGHMIKYSPDSYLIDLEKGNQSAREKDARFQRFRFVVLNQYYLMNDIATGDGEYLRAYFDSRPSDIAYDNYQKFLGHVSSRSQLLLSTLDPLVFIIALRKSEAYLIRG